MSEIIQCPTCSKKFRLPSTPPAEFTCSSCQTVMDLSGFGGSAEPETASAPAGRRSRAAGRRSGGAARRGGGGGRARGGGRRGRGTPPPDDYDDDDGRRGYAKKKDNTPMIVGSIAAVAILLVLVLVLVNRGDDDPAPAGDGDGGSTPVASTDGTSASTSDPLTSGMPAPVPGATPVAPVPGMPTAPIAGADADEDDPGATKPPVRRGGSPRLKDVQLKTFDWPDEVDEETRAQAELQVENLWIGGRDGADAEEWFVEQGNKLAGRLISEFPRIQQEYGLEDRRAKTDFMVLDRILSKMDGYIARKWHSTHPITHVSTESIIEKRLKQWTVWFDMGYWSEPVRPWDPRVDEEDSAEDGAKPKPKERGFAENK